MFCVCVCDVFPNFGTYDNEDKLIMKEQKEWIKPKASTNSKCFSKCN